MKDFNKIFTLLGVALFVAVIFILLPSASAQEDASVADLRKEIDGMDLTAGEKYYEISDMRSKTLLMLLEMERVNVSSDVKQFIFSVKDFLNTFESTYKKAEAGGVSDHRASINKGRDMKKMASDLKLYKNNPELKKYEYVPRIVDNADEVVKRFLDDEGAYFEEMADYENVTPIKIKYLDDAITAYDESGNDEKRYEINEKYKELNSEFIQDMTYAKTEKAEADVLLNKSDALKDSENILDLFSAFWSSREARIKYENFEKKYTGHNLNSEGCSENIKCSHEYYETFNEVVVNRFYVSEISDKLRSVILKYIAVVAFIVLIILIYFQRNYSSYKEDTRDAKLGKELGLDKEYLVSKIK